MTLPNELSGVIRSTRVLRSPRSLGTQPWISAFFWPCRRTRGDPNPRFKQDLTHQLDAVVGCPAAQVPESHLAPAVQVPERHLARTVLSIVGRLNLKEAGKQYSSLGRHRYHPQRVLGVWVYASLIGLHHSTKVAHACKTDAAFRFLSGGYALSRA